MDLPQLSKTAFELIASLTLILNSSFTPISSPAPDTSYKHVSKQPEVEETILVTVELPPVIYTVTKPLPAPIKSRQVGEPKPTTMPVKKDPETPLQTPSPTPTPIPSSTTVPMGNSNSELLFQMVNEYRVTLGLKAFEKDERLCKIAQDRAPQVNNELSGGTLHKGFKDLNLPYWATENIASYLTIEENLKFWLSDYIHKKAIESDSKYSCISCFGASCSQIFTSFIEK